MAFEETAKELAKNVASLGFDVNGLIAKKKMAIDDVRIERSEIQETASTTWRVCLSAWLP